MRFILLRANLGSSNCVPLALSNVTNLPFTFVNEWLKSKGYRKGNHTGTSTHLFTATEEWQLEINELKFYFDRMPFEGLTVGQFHRAHGHTGSYIIETSAHWLSSRGGVIYDTANKPNRQIKAIWKLMAVTRYGKIINP